MQTSSQEKRDKELFDRISNQYSYKDVYPISKKARAFQIDSIIDFVKKNYQLREKNSLLELGCGSGANSLYLEELYDEYMGVDYSQGLIEIANQKYRKKNVTFDTANIKDLSKFNSYDIVFGLGILHHVDDLAKVLNELKKVGHSDTIYIFYEPQAGNPFLQFLRRLRMKIDPAFSEEQIFFRVKELEERIKQQKFNNIVSRYNGYFIPPFAQVVLKPYFLFNPIVKAMMKIDRFLFRKINSRFSWNFVIAFKK
jgi:2-polyprenyl-3-methyl-5-hydroxy-6-metoxy-1,4-benzoquinol methylase